MSRSHDPAVLLTELLQNQRAKGKTHVRLRPDTIQSLAQAGKSKSGEIPASPKPTRSTQPSSARSASSTPPDFRSETRQTAPPSAPARTLEPIILQASDLTGKIEELRGLVMPCTKCPHLAKSRTQPVFGIGNPRADIFFVGEAPGADEDEQGEPFVGRAGQLLTKMIEAMGLSRADVYIANILKCRPDMPSGASGNRKPKAEEMATCLPYLVTQIDLIQPKLLVALGSTAVQGLLGKEDPIGRLRGRWQEFRGTPVMPTYHPSYLLHNPVITEKRKVWEDLMLVMEKAALPISAKQRAFFTKP